MVGFVAGVDKSALYSSKTKKNIVLVSMSKVSCIGDSQYSDSSHPKMTLKINRNSETVTCPYCGTVFTMNLKPKNQNKTTHKPMIIKPRFS